MKKLISDIARKSVKELEKELMTLKQEVAKLQLERMAKPQKDTNMVMKKKRNIAQIATVLSEKKLFEASQPKVKS